MSEVIRCEFNVSYHPSQVGRIPKDCGWSRQKPVRRATQRDEEAIQSFPGRSGRSAGPRSIKAIDENRTLVFVDQSGFYLLPLVLCTYAPAGKTPVIREYVTHDHLSVMSGITPKGKLYMTVQGRPYKGPDVVNFLHHLLRHIPGPSGEGLVLWDRAPIHRSRVVKEYLAGGAAARVQLELLPA